MSEDKEYAYHENKRTDKIYISKAIEFEGSDSKLRIASKVIDSNESYTLVMEQDKIVLRVTPSGRQEIQARFYEENRDDFRLVIQKFSKKDGEEKPLKTSFNFSPKETRTLLQFISSLKQFDFKNDENINLTDKEFQKILLSPTQAKHLVETNQE